MISHSLLADYRAALPEALYAGLFKFSVLRNPWERVISAYFSPHQVINLRVREGWKREIFLEKLQSDWVSAQPMRHLWKIGRAPCAFWRNGSSR